MQLAIVDEGSELSEKIGQLKMVASDGKMRMTDVADVEQQHAFGAPEKRNPPKALKNSNLGGHVEV